MIAQPVVLVSIFRESLIGGVSVHSSNLYDRLVEEGIGVEKVNYAEAFLQSNPFAKGFTLLGQGARLVVLRLRGARLFHFHASNQALVYYLFGPLLALLGAKLILSIHSGYGFDKWLGEHPGYDRVNRLLFRALDRLVFMNPEESGRIAERYPFLRNRIVTVNPFIAPPRSVLERNAHAPAAAEFRVATVGAWGPRYNVEEAVEATYAFAGSVDVPVRMTVIQSTSLVVPDYREEVLGKFAEWGNRITIDLVEDTDDILGLLSRQDLFIRPSKGDSYGLCVAEALVVGTPAIVTDVCRRCSAATLYRQGDTERLTALIAAVYAKRGGPYPSLLSPSEDSFTGYRAVYSDLS